MEEANELNAHSNKLTFTAELSYGTLKQTFTAWGYVHLSFQRYSLTSIDFP